MDVAALSVVTHQNAVRQQAGIAVMKKAMDAAKGNTEALLKTMELSVAPHLGSNLDLKV